MVYIKSAYFKRIGARSLTFAIVGVALILLASCTVGPNYVKPTTEVPVAYKEMEGWKAAQPKDEVTAGSMVGDLQRSRVEQPRRTGHDLESERG